MHQKSQHDPTPGKPLDDLDVELAEEETEEELEDEIEHVPFAHTTENGFKSPFYQWSLKLAQTDRPHECLELSEQAYRELQVERVQPFRKAILDEQEIGLPISKTNGPLMLHDSFDPATNTDPDAEPPPGIPMRSYRPGTPANDILAGMAEDMIHVGSVMVARMRVALGYESDAKMIRLYKELALSLYKMHHITRAQKPKRPRGRPRKNPQ